MSAKPRTIDEYLAPLSNEKRVIDPAQLEALRERHRPDAVQVLFVGESPPAGGTFFYAANSDLFRYTKKAFAQVYGHSLDSSQAFLLFFQQRGCFLDDLCSVPVNNLTSSERQRCRTDGIPSLANRIRLSRPRAIVTVMLASKSMCAKPQSGPGWLKFLNMRSRFRQIRGRDPL